MFDYSYDEKLELAKKIAATFLAFSGNISLRKAQQNLHWGHDPETFWMPIVDKILETNNDKVRQALNGLDGLIRSTRLRIVK